MKKILAGVLTLMIAVMTGNGLYANELGISLYEFINTTENITAKYEYPSMKISMNSANKKLLPAHTPVVIINNSLVTTKNIVSGDKLSFTVLQDVKDRNGNILIKSGSPVEANLTFEKTERIGKSGKLTISDFHTTAVDGSYIPLASTISVAPDDKEVLSITLSILLCPLFLLMKGQHAEIPEGYTKTIYTHSDVYVKTEVL